MDESHSRSQKGASNLVLSGHQGQVALGGLRGQVGVLQAAAQLRHLLLQGRVTRLQRGALGHTYRQTFREGRLG